MSANTRSAVLAAIRAANGGATTLDAATAAWREIERSYEQSSPAPQAALVELFVDRLRDYDALVTPATQEALPQLILAAVAEANVRRLGVPEGMTSIRPETLLRAGVELVDGDSATAAELDHVEAVLTESTLGIAETGTIVLQNVAGQGARALSLVPDLHLCVVRVADVVATVPEAFAKLAATATLPTTFVSGPSATADIEMTRIKGVHGPRFLHVFLVE